LFPDLGLPANDVSFVVFAGVNACHRSNLQNAPVQRQCSASAAPVQRKLLNEVIIPSETLS
ncbi:MAG: hypothetical protein AB1344_08325, partial [Pseudomonadota bacterium]